VFSTRMWSKVILVLANPFLFGVASIILLNTQKIQKNTPRGTSRKLVEKWKICTCIPFRLSK
jgi:hypothetical protein